MSAAHRHAARIARTMPHACVACARSDRTPAPHTAQSRATHAPKIAPHAAQSRAARPQNRAAHRAITLSTRLKIARRTLRNAPLAKRRSHANCAYELATATQTSHATAPEDPTPPRAREQSRQGEHVQGVSKAERQRSRRSANLPHRLRRSNGADSAIGERWTARESNVAGLAEGVEPFVALASFSFGCFRFAGGSRPLLISGRCGNRQRPGDHRGTAERARCESAFRSGTRSTSGRVLWGLARGLRSRQLFERASIRGKLRMGDLGRRRLWRLREAAWPSTNTR